MGVCMFACIKIKLFNQQGEMKLCTGTVPVSVVQKYIYTRTSLPGGTHRLSGRQECK